MLRLLPNTVEVEITAQGVHVEHRGLTGRILRTITVPAEQEHQGGLERRLLDCYTEALRQLRRRRARVRVRLTNQLVRFAVCSYPIKVRPGIEQENYAHHVFTKVYAEPMREWTVRASATEPDGSALACAIRTALLNELQQRAQSVIGNKVVSVIPAAVTVFNGIPNRSELEDGWIVIAEPGYVLCFLIVKGSWHSVHIERPRTPLALNLEAILDRHATLHGVIARPDSVYVFAPHEAHDTNFPLVGLGLGVAQPVSSTDVERAANELPALCMVSGGQST